MISTRLQDFVKAYDVRGLVPEQLSVAVARAFGAAFAEQIARPESGQKSAGVVIGYDMRPSSPELAAAFAQGVVARGVDATVIGLCSTDGLYYASGILDLPGAMFTASHNPAQYNGIKMCRAGAAPISTDTGLAQVRDQAQDWLDHGEPDPVSAIGSISEQNLLADYAAMLRGLVDLSSEADLGVGRPLKVVVDAGNGMGGLTVPAVLGTHAGLAPLPLQIVPLYFELDGTFPNHPANPLEPANLVDLQHAVREHGADIGLAFDGDADRCFVVDERGEPVSASAVTALVAVREIDRAVQDGTPAEQIRVVHNLISSLAVPEIIREHGAIPVRTRVGHSFIKSDMADNEAIFGGEHSAHYYFKDFWYADTGMLAAMHVLSALRAHGGSLSDLMAGYSRYVPSGEINSTVADKSTATQRVRSMALGMDGVVQDSLDGLTFTHESAPMWWLNVRGSNTEPLLRLNVEAADESTMTAIRDRALAAIRADDEETGLL
ncbi:MAG: phosphomannomutase/phosphoglucomutase [Actinomycetota bacterium]|nr:phosphomannomutase/phosphoglucomutase [Actinomycetota bacterium]